jgi:hypothetical protein
MNCEINKDCLLHSNAHTEWKYVDAQDSNGWKIATIFYPRIGINPPTVSIYINSPEGEELSKHLRGTAYLEEGNIEISGQELKTNTSGLKLRLDTSNIRCNLQFTPEIKPYPITIKQGNMRWQIEIPRAQVNGQLIKDGINLDFSGIGYHDHNWFTHQDPKDKMDNREILSYFLRGWQFGRLFSKGLTMVYGFSKTESHFLLWEKDNVIMAEHIMPLTATEFSRSEKLGAIYPTKFNLASLGIDSSIYLVGVLSEKKLSLLPDGTQTGYIRLKASTSSEKLGKLDGIHEIWL